MTRRLLACIVLLLYFPCRYTIAQTGNTGFWSTQQRGANYFNQAPTREWLVAAKKAGITLIRLVPNKWKTSNRDFLFGNADHFETIDEQDFALLNTVLNQADTLGINVLFSTLSLPGARWKQQNGDKLDLRLWRDTTYLPQAVRFWKELAGRLKHHSCIAGYNILNEPTPEKAARPSLAQEGNIIEWYKTVENSAADLNKFNRTVVNAIREVDNTTPIILDCGNWASAASISYLNPLPDTNILYAFHMYEPFDYTNLKANKGRFTYPGKIPLDDSEGENKEALTTDLNKKTLESLVAPVIAWQQNRNISSNRIVVEEFGCNRMTKGAERYLEDLIDIFNQQRWHWLFYSFREDGWPGMDYELGTKQLGEAYWKQQEMGRIPQPKRFDNPLWNVIKKNFVTHK